MITLETGVPGAGKTLYCVDKLLRPLVGTSCTYETPDGTMAQAPRTIYTNINGLLLEHEKIGPGAAWSYDDKRGTLQPDEAWTQAVDGDKNGLNNWHEWAKPGSVIVYDEVQKPWPLAPAGSKVPPCITALETHRHMGVDFIVLTQHPMLIHANLVRLVGRHLHIRRMGNMGLAIVYEWDSCSRTLLYKNALAKAPYRYSKAVFELYKSAELHTKQPRKIPSLVWGILIGLLALAYFAPSSYSRIAERISPSKVAKDANGKPAGQTVVTTSVGPPPGIQGPSSAPVSPSPLSVVEEVAGCVSSGPLCRCYTAAARPVQRSLEFCEAETSTPTVKAPPVQFSHVPDLAPSTAYIDDLDMIKWAQSRRRAL